MIKLVKCAKIELGQSRTITSRRHPDQPLEAELEDEWPEDERPEDEEAREDAAGGPCGRRRMRGEKCENRLNGERRGLKVMLVGSVT